ncbi:hypothetical protein HU200_056018 [Digitaria exilis]|uniref:Uncharacterized protein n=1 Tax=Digitaria exilis TaxID=1010633 RepID=A0A835E5B9_9POAL|nr:hypothetical protein HU200_056018 [Digitaria exilis]
MRPRLHRRVDFRGGESFSGLFSRAGPPGLAWGSNPVHALFTWPPHRAHHRPHSSQPQACSSPPHLFFFWVFPLKVQCQCGVSSTGNRWERNGTERNGTVSHHARRAVSEASVRPRLAGPPTTWPMGPTARSPTATNAPRWPYPPPLSVTAVRCRSDGKKAPFGRCGAATNVWPYSKITPPIGIFAYPHPLGILLAPSPFGRRGPTAVRPASSSPSVGTGAWTPRSTGTHLEFSILFIGFVPVPSRAGAAWFCMQAGTAQSAGMSSMTPARGRSQRTQGRTRAVKGCYTPELSRERLWSSRTPGYRVLLARVAAGALACAAAEARGRRTFQRQSRLDTCDVFPEPARDPRGAAAQGPSPPPRPHNSTVARPHCLAAVADEPIVVMRPSYSHRSPPQGLTPTQRRRVNVDHGRLPRSPDPLASPARSPVSPARRGPNSPQRRVSPSSVPLTLLMTEHTVILFCSALVARRELHTMARARRRQASSEYEDGSGRFTWAEPTPPPPPQQFGVCGPPRSLFLRLHSASPSPTFSFTAYASHRWERSASAEDPRLEAQNLSPPTKLQPHITPFYSSPTHHTNLSPPSPSLSLRSNEREEETETRGEEEKPIL